MNPMHDTTLTIAQLAGGQIDARRDQLSAQTLRERIELERAIRRERARQRRHALISRVRTAARGLIEAMPRGLRPTGGFAA